MKLKVLVVGLVFISLLTGCRADMPEYKGNTRYFRIISDEINGEIVYDTRTGVEYWRSDGYSNVLTVLVDADEKPLIYDRSAEE